MAHNELVTKQQLRTFELVCNVSGYVEGELKDWPAQMQDAVYAALELKAAELELPLAIVHSYCDIDHGETAAQDQFFVCIIASEIVARDERFTSAQAMKRAFAELLQNKGTLQ